MPGVALNLAGLFQARINLVAGIGANNRVDPNGVAATHNIIDEAQTRTDNALRFVSAATIFDVNADNSGALIGPAWNPSTNAQLQ